MRWRRRRTEAAEDEVAGASAAGPEVELAEDAPPDEIGRFGRTRGIVVGIFVGVLGVAVLSLAWVARRHEPSVDVAQGPLLVSPQGQETGPATPTSTAEGRRPERAGATSPSAGAGPRAAGYADEAMAMSYAVSLAERQAMLAELRARQEKAGAEARQAEAHARESEIWVRAIERNPKLIL